MAHIITVSYICMVCRKSFTHTHDASAHGAAKCPTCKSGINVVSTQHPLAQYNRKVTS